MPQTKLKPSEVASETRTRLIPDIVEKYPQLTHSIAYPDTKEIQVLINKGDKRKLLVAVIEGDAVDIALDWHNANYEGDLEGNSLGVTGSSIPLICAANAKQAGGQWETNVVAPEECLSRRSTLVKALTTPYETSSTKSHYPMDIRSGIYSPSVVVFRGGHSQKHCTWERYKYLPVISVPPVRLPKLTGSGVDYCFDEERQLMKEKMRGAVRIAADKQHSNIVIGNFGMGPGFRNPPGQVARMWKEILFGEQEFEGVFSNVVFGFEDVSQVASKDEMPVVEVFRRVFHPANIVQTSYRNKEWSEAETTKPSTLDLD